jgi:hypothetical protein
MGRRGGGLFAEGKVAAGPLRRQRLDLDWHGQPCAVHLQVDLVAAGQGVAGDPDLYRRGHRLVWIDRRQVRREQFARELQRTARVQRQVGVPANLLSVGHRESEVAGEAGQPDDTELLRIGGHLDRVRPCSLDYLTIGEGRHRDV